MKFDLSFSHLNKDLSAGLIVFLVALPLCLGISLACNMPFFSGILAGVIGGIVVGLLSNSQLSVSGPAAGLVAIVLAGVATLGSIEAFFLAVLISGIFQLLLGTLKAGVIANYFPSSVIKGMLTGIGIIIILKQIPHALGYDPDFEGDFAFLRRDGENTFTEIYNAIGHIDAGASLLAIFGLILIFAFEKPQFKKLIGPVPGALVAVVLAVLINEFVFAFIPALKIRQEHLVNIPISANGFDLKTMFVFPDFTRIFDPNVWIIGVTIAAVASIETLLCIEAVDNIDEEKRVTNTNRELIAQGAGNILSGFLGGLPITSVIVRSSANVNAGGKTKLSAIFHGVLLLLTVLLIPNILNKIPLAILASILLHTGYKLAKPEIFKKMYSFGKKQWIPFIVTVLGVVFLDLLKGVGIGLAVSVVYILWKNMKNAYFLHNEKKIPGVDYNLVLAEEVSFLNKASIRAFLDAVPENKTVRIDATYSKYIDFDVAEIIKEYRDVKAPLKNITLELKNFKEEYEK